MTRHLMIPLISFLLISCSENHYHDGKYKATVFNAAMTWVNDEEIEIKGNEMYLKSRSSFDNEVYGEFKTSCRQYPDRIEFKGKEGLTVIARLDKDGNFKIGEYVYEKINSNQNTKARKTEVKSPPENKSIITKPETFQKGKTEDVGKTDVGEKGIKTISDGEIGYYYVDNIQPDVNESFFQGTKNFVGHSDDLYKLTIEGSRITINDIQNGSMIVLQGIIRNGEILKSNGKKSRFVYKAPFLYHYNDLKQWDIFEEYAEVSDESYNILPPAKPRAILGRKTTQHLTDTTYQ